MSGGLETKYRNPTEKVRDAVNEIYEEYLAATEKFGPFNSAHEGWAIIREEVDELWEEIKKKKDERSITQMEEEAKQIGAMALRFIIDICD